MQIDSDLDGGNIEVVSARDLSRIELAMRRDTNAEFMQWFHFRARGVRGKPCAFHLVNAGEATYPDAYEDYRACASYDGDEWFRVETTFDGSTLRFIHTPERDQVLYAYFAPYTWARHEALLARASRAGGVSLEQVGASVEGRPMTVVRIGEPDEEKRTIWIVARQHPGETMAEWFMEGVLDRLIDGNDELATMLRERATFYLVPNMNPDGGVRGNLRANAAGVNLNRAWMEPDEATSPEVLGVRARMFETGVDLFLDVHGDERNPYCFAAGCEGNPSYDERIDALEDQYMESLCELDEDFQREYGYERDAPGEGDLTTAGNWAGETFGCLSLTVEMPFKDDANHPRPEEGWSPRRAKTFGRTNLESVLVVLDTLR